MRKLDTTHLFVGPSLASGLTSILGAGIFLLIANSSILESGGFMTDLLLGTNTTSGLLVVAQQTSFEINELTLGNPMLNKVLFFLFWMMVGLVVYVILQTLGSTLKSISETVEDVQLVKARKAHLDQSLLIRSSIRMASAIALIFMYILTARFIVPFSTLASKAWLGSLGSLIGWFYGVLGLIVLALAIHIFIVLIRLIVLRPRLFGGWDVFM